MRISRHDEDMATSRNCVVLSVNGGAEVDFGCNRLENFQHDPQRASRTVTIKALPMPHCNVVRIRVLTQTNQGLTQVENRTTANGAQVADRRIWIFKTLGDYKFLLNINDNEDDIPNDVNMTLDGLGSLFFTVENSGLGCKP